MQKFTRLVTPQEVDSESDNDDMEDDEERPAIGGTARSKASENESEGASHTSKDGVVALEPGVEPGPVASTGAGVGHEDGTEERPGAQHGESGEQHAALDEQMETQGPDKEDSGGDDNCAAGANTEAAAEGGEEHDEHVAAAEHAGGHQRGDGPQDKDKAAPAAGPDEGAPQVAEEIDSERDRCSMAAS